MCYTSLAIMIKISMTSAPVTSTNLQSYHQVNGWSVLKITMDLRVKSCVIHMFVWTLFCFVEEVTNEMKYGD